MASDGIWDNMFEKDVINCVKQSMPKKKAKDTNVAKLLDLQKAADCLATEAERLGNQVGYWSPFAIEARKYYRDFEPRGKADDVTVIVAQMHSKEQPAVVNNKGPVSYEKFFEQEPQGTDYSDPYYVRNKGYKQTKFGLESDETPLTIDKS